MSQEKNPAQELGEITAERRFQGVLSEEYELFRRVYPHFDDLQRWVAQEVAALAPKGLGEPLRVLEIGCGTGRTTQALLLCRPDLVLTSLDNEPQMIEQAQAALRGWAKSGRVGFTLSDALGFLKEQPGASWDVVASVLTLHNMKQGYRRELHREIFRVLAPGGLFVNADKYTPPDEERFPILQNVVGLFFDTLVPLGKWELLRQWILHVLADQAPDRVMWEKQSVLELSEVGFNDIRVGPRAGLEALLRATKPPAAG